MEANRDRIRDYARYALAGIRIVNGALALFAPAFLARRLGFDPEENAPAKYVFRLFGVRTIVVGAALLQRNEAVRMRSVRIAPLIHASDVGAAVIAGVYGQMTKGAAVKAALISTVNTVLAIIALPPR